ncbi:MAG: hypothetical protein KJ077_47695 [Anaerolineae bacterium]|nr:hypothetical protein [Anaerolineae bacterium]
MPQKLVMILSLLILLTACAQNQPTQPAPTAAVGQSVTIEAGQPAESVETQLAEVRSLAVDPLNGYLLAATASGLYQSQDEGQSWQPMTLPADIPANGIAHVAIRPDQPDIVYLAGEPIGIWRSRDAGQTWQKVTQGLENEQVTALALHSNGYPRDNTKSLFAWVADVGIFESHDEGDTWKRSVDQGPPNRQVLALTHTPLPGSMNTGWLYAATPDGAYLSMD